ncbi:hypothetical protein [Streptomyces sp. 8L]|uniref:hypothetical protein n=1 Tax=Streptomyces sp. 8L TaxID=2877242 RepID=UPI001CD33D1D|nr:hypothetical protein [Streptomyces sp. 8L]MCA1223465.1 hypothetical protein [Streptomyces sp. 8L]
MGLLSGLRTVVIDAWSYLNYKPVFSDHHGMPNRRAFPEAQAMWVPEEDQRRLAAYKLLAAYDQNQAAQLAAASGDHHAEDRREFGDPSMFIDTTMAHVLGAEQTITIPGADHDGEKPDADEVMAARVQELLRTWADDEQFPMRLQQCERKAVALGDGVYRLAWDPGKQRPTVRVTDPGFYFPVIGEDDDGGEYPIRVHFAWELPEDPKRGLKARIRRITYELDWIRPATGNGVDQNSRPVRATLPVLISEPVEGEEAIPAPPLTSGDLLNPDTGAISRQYAWNDTPSYVTCYLTDATWNIGDIKGPVDVDTLPLDIATFGTGGDGQVLDHLDLLIDFVPVVHLTNTVPAAEEHWGQSTLAKVLQVLDELAGTDTDSSRASATTGAPIIGVWGKGTPQNGRSDLEVAPGAVWTLGEGGGMIVADTSKNLAELRNQRHDLQDRAANVTRLPAVALGTVDPSKVPSGYALQLSLGPMDALVSSMRLARDPKYFLFLKFVQRLFIAGQHPDWAAVTVQPARLTFGSYTPTDKTAVLEQVKDGVTNGVLSLETGVKMLQEAGFPIEDIEEEIQRIQSRAFSQAKDLADALGNPKETADFLGREAPSGGEQAPQVILPPADGSTPQDGQLELPEEAPRGSGGNTP